MSSTLISRAAAVLAALTLAACGETAGPADGIDPVAAPAHARVSIQAHDADVNDPEVRRWLGQLRASLARYQRFEVAQDDGYVVDLTGCMEENGAGMGHHFGKPELIFNDYAEALAPELLLYEPQENGRMKLVGVEYIIPFSELPDTEPAPSLNGVSFHRNYRFNVWALHAWVFEHNPDGIFADWNPRITCAYATTN